jgi:glycosyltransferase involved in cell wall biosynthesis
MATNPYLSIIIPAYQAEATLTGCLEAILSQKEFTDFEIIVVDDHSSDRTAEVAGRFPVRLLRQDENRGAGAARNLGARESCGEILLFVDADVYLEPSVLSRVARLFRECPEIDAAVGTYSELPAAEDAISIYHNFFTFYHHELSPDRIEWFWGALGVVRREIFEKVGGFPEGYGGAAAEDIELGYAMAMAGCRIAYQRELRGAHARRFTLGSMLFNDYRKAVLAVKLYITKKEIGSHSHGFFNLRNGINILIMYPLLLTLLVFLLTGQGISILILCLLVLLVVNYSFYSFIHKSKRGIFVLRAMLLHWLSFAAAGAGSLMGLVGLALGRPLESKSPWL